MQKMNADCNNPESSSGRFLHSVRPLRDLESNWTVDLAKNLEEYLLKICSGQISDDDATLTVNFAEGKITVFFKNKIKKWVFLFVWAYFSIFFCWVEFCSCIAASGICAGV